MKAGLTNLETLKRHLLAGSLASGKQFDLQIKMLGLGVAALFDKFCNRELLYHANAEVVTTADRSHLVVPCYPIVEVASVSTKGLGESDWTAQANEPQLFNATSGVVHFSGELGDDKTLVKVVYTGGYWFDENEPGDEPGEAPEGAFELPDDLRSAFLLQVEAVWAQKDKLGSGLVDKPQATGSLQSVELLPLVKEMLRGYVRYQLT